MVAMKQQTNRLTPQLWGRNEVARIHGIEMQHGVGARRKNNPGCSLLAVPCTHAAHFPHPP